MAKQSFIPAPVVRSHFMHSAGRTLRLDPNAQGGVTAPAAAPAATAPATLDVAALRQAFRSELDTALAPIAQRQTAVEQQLAQAVRPQSQSGATPSQLFGGGAPAVQAGEQTLTSRGYSIGRAMFALATGDWSNAKLEQGLHNRLHQFYGGHLGGGSFFMPLGEAHLQGLDAGFAAECGEVVRAGVAGADLGQIRRMIQALRGAGHVVRQDLSIWDESAGAVMLGSIAQGEMIELLRNREVVSQAGARDITLPPNGRMTWPKHTGATTGYWVGESQTITGSTITTGQALSMSAKKLAALTSFPQEFLRFTTPGTEAFLRNEMATTLALTLDSAVISTNEGSGIRPKGLLAYPGIQSHTATTTATDGNTFEPEDVLKMVAKLEEVNIDSTGFTFATRPTLWACLSTRRADAVSAGDKKGPFVFTTQNGPAGNGGAFASLMGYRVVRSNQISNTITKGGSSDLTQVLGGVWNELLIGRAGVLEFSLDPYAGVNGTNFKTDVISMKAIQHVDFAPRREEAFVLCSQLYNR